MCLYQLFWNGNFCYKLSIDSFYYFDFFGIQIIASFYLKPLPKSDKIYDIFGYLKRSFKDTQKREMFYVEFLNGLTLSDGVLGTVITILIMFSLSQNLI